MPPEKVITALAHSAITVQCLLAAITLICAFVERRHLGRLFGPLLIMGCGFLTMAARRLTAVLLNKHHPNLEVLDRGVLPLVASLFLLLGVTLLIRALVVPPRKPD